MKVRQKIKELLPAFLSVIKLFVGEGMHNLLFPNQDAKPKEFWKQYFFLPFAKKKALFFFLKLIFTDIEDLK